MDNTEPIREFEEVWEKEIGPRRASMTTMEIARLSFLRGERCGILKTSAEMRDVLAGKR